MNQRIPVEQVSTKSQPKLKEKLMNLRMFHTHPGVPLASSIEPDLTNTEGLANLMNKDAQ